MSRRDRKPALVLTIGVILAGAASAQTPALPLPCGGASRPAPPDPRCAAEGADFIYSKAVDTCVKIGGAVAVGVGAGRAPNSLRR